MKSYLYLQLVLFHVIFVLPLYSHAQDVQHSQFDVITSENKILRKGLSQNTVYSIMQDQHGYMWFGTWDGLNKFDGYNFTIFDKRDGLSNEVIKTMIETADGNIWIGTENGLNCYNAETGKIRYFIHIPGDSTSLSDNWINYLYQDKPGRLLICTRKGLNIMDLETGLVRNYQSRESDYRRTRSNNINYLVPQGKIYWVATDFGLVRYDVTTGENVRYLNRPGDPHSLSHNQVNVVFVDSRGSLWVGTEHGLNLMDEKTGQFRVFRHSPANPASLSHNMVKAIFEDSFGRLWIGTDGGGLNIYDRENRTFQHVQNNPAESGSLSNNRIYSIYQDETGNIWFGTFKGVNIIDRFTSNFSLYTHNPNDKNCVANNLVWSFAEIEPNVFWIGTDNGISIFNRTTNSFSHIPYIPGKENGLSSKRIRPILKDSKGIIWIGTRDAGLSRLDPKTGKYTHFQPNVADNNGIGDNYVISLLQDKEGMIWAGTNNGLNRINPNSMEFKLYGHDPDDSTSISDNTVYYVYEDRSGDLWFATSNGLNRYVRGSDSFEAYFHYWQQGDQISSDRIFTIYEDSDNNMWLGTRGGGLELFDRETGTFHTYTEEDGLPNNVIYSILEDEKGNLWMSTNWGLSKFYKDEELFINYDVTDGLQSNEFNANAHIKSSGGEIFFGGMKGFNSFYSSEIMMNPNKPRVVITAFKKFNKPQPGLFQDGDTIVVNHDDNFFSIEFAALDYTNPMKNKYSYILENYSKNWTEVDGTRHFAEFTKVMPGTYNFRVTGSNNNGVWNNEGVTLTIVVNPPWYATWYFRIAVILLIALTIWSFIYFRVRRIRRKHTMEKKVLQIEKQLFDIQQKALRLQMNPHFIFNSLNSIQSYILSNDIDLAVNYLGRFSQLMRMILANSRESIIPLADELQAITHYLEIEKLRFDDKFSYSIKVDPVIDEEFTGIPPMIIQPYIENS
ncbi:MAG: two-component regulator propeller domain-containing protein, partial [Bacteroidales bacterium]